MEVRDKFSREQIDRRIIDGDSGHAGTLCEAELAIARGRRADVALLYSCVVDDDSGLIGVLYGAELAIL